MVVPGGAEPGRTVRIDLPSGLRIRVALPPGALPEAVVSFHLPDEVLASLDLDDAAALGRGAFAVELDEDDEDDKPDEPDEPDGGGGGSGGGGGRDGGGGRMAAGRRECRPGLLYSDAATSRWSAC